MRRVIVVFVLAIVAAIAHASAAQQLAPGFAAGPLLPGEVLLTVPLTVDGLPRGQIDVVLTPSSGAIAADATPLVELLTLVLRGSVLDDVAAAVDARGLLSLSNINAAGLTAAFDEAALRLDLNVPAGARSRQEIEFGARPPFAEQVVPPARVSAYLNFNLRNGFTQIDETGTRDPAVLFLDGAANVSGWALIADGTWTESAEFPWRRGAVRLVRDLPADRMRWTVGDLTYGTTGFQSSVALGGVSVAKNFALQPYRAVRPAGETEFLLESPATVDFFVNGRLFRTLRLGPGPYSARSFSFLDGVNLVRAEIAEDSGRRTELDLLVPFDSGLLLPGETEAQAVVGFPSYSAGSESRYRTRIPTVSGFYRRGITDSLTATGHAQGTGTRSMAGGGAVWATEFGTLTAAAAGSRRAGDIWGHAVRLEFERDDPRPSNTAQRSWSTAAEYRGNRFVTLGSVRTTNDTAWILSARYGQRIPLSLSFAVSGIYEKGRGGRRDTRRANLFLGRGLFEGATAGLRLRHSLDTAGVGQFGAFVTVSVRLPGSGRQHVTLHRDTAFATNTVEWRSRQDQPVGDYSAFASVSRSASTESAAADLSYTGARGRAGISATSDVPRLAGPERERTANIRLGTALVYADGAFAVGGPVRDAFAIVTPHPAIVGFLIGVNPTGDGAYVAQIDRFGPAVLPALSPYRTHRVTFDGRNLPIGHDLGAGVVSVTPGFKTGTRLQVGTEGTVLLTAVVQDAGGAPISLLGGQIEAPTNPEFVPMLTFTNRAGRLTLQGLQPGAFVLRLIGYPDRPIPLDIPAGTVGVFDAGALRLPPLGAGP